MSDTSHGPGSLQGPDSETAEPANRMPAPTGIPAEKPPNKGWWSRLARGYKVVGVLTAFIGLISGGLALYDRVFPANPGPPEMTVAVESAADIVRLTDFLSEHNGETVELHVSCRGSQDVCRRAPAEFLPITSEEETLAFLYRDKDCTQLPAANEGPCANQIWWLWAIVTDDTDHFVTTPGGAGTVAFDGLFDVRIGFRTTLIGPEYATTAGLVAVRD